MESDLEKYLNILNSEKCFKTSKEARFILEKIGECFEEEQSQFTIGLLVGLVFDENNGIFTFIWKTCEDSESTPSVVAALKLLEYLIKNFSVCTEPYFCLLYEKCLHLSNARLAKVREVSLKLIKYLIAADSKNVLDLSKLTEKLEKHLREESKIPGSVLEEIYGILGYLFEKYPELLKSKKEWFFEKMCESLRHDLQVTKNPSTSKILGAFEGINGYLVNYSLPSEEYVNKIYEYVKNSSQYTGDKKIAGHAALKILHNYWRIFDKHIYDDRDFWKNNLLRWIKQNSADRQSALLAFNALYSVITLFLNKDFNPIVVTDYLKEFERTLNSVETNAYERRSALTGIKLFVLTHLLKGKEFNKTYEFVINFVKKQESYQNFTYMPLCVECISAFILNCSKDQNFYAEQLSCLERVSVKVINQYPKIESSLQPDALTALEKSFYMLGICNLQIMENHIDRVLYQGLIRSCSSMTVFDFELLKESGQKDVEFICYKSYLSLWKYLLNLTNSPNLPVGGSFALKKGVALKLFDSFINSFLRIISKLNFNLGGHPDQEREVEVEKPGDLNIFINCVDLYQELIPLTDNFHLSNWLIKILQTFIQLSYKNPLVAGFYKLVTATFKAADRLQFFEDSLGENQKMKCLELVRKFLEDTLMKVDQYKGELQVACLKILLAAPVTLIEPFVEKTIPALEVIIHIGRGHFPLLKDLVEALERWDLRLPSSALNEITRRVLPHFDVFFQSPYFRGNNLVDSTIEGKKLKKKLVFNDSELLTLQKKFLIFLGHTDVNRALNLIESPESEEEERLISDKQLTYQLPFRNGQTEIDLDEILLRAMDLAGSCGDRRIRITACEFLYSAVMIVLTNINQLSGGYTWLFRKIVKTCLALGCDSDGVVCQIFEPLMYQITHYFSGKKTLHFSETKELIDILMDSVTRPYDPAVRDFSALLIREFTVWSIRQLTAEELKATPESIKRILEKIYSLALHPSYNKRVGAAVVFNKIYSVLREEDFVLEAYWFQLFYYFMESLRMCDGPENVTEIEAAVHHVKRPLSEKHGEFNKASPERIVPPEFEGGLLCHLVKWTVERCSDARPSTRRTAMNVVEELAPKVPDCDSVAAFVGKYFPEKPFPLQEKSDFRGEDGVQWLKHQCGAFEHCSWLLAQKVFSAEEVMRLGFGPFSRNYVEGIRREKDGSAEVERLKHQSVTSYLNLLFFLRERSHYFTSEVWNFLRTSIFEPSSLGFDLNRFESSENLFSLLTQLLRFCSVKFISSDWNYFYENLESAMSVPVLSCVTRNRYVGLKNVEFLFALKVIESSGFWNGFAERMMFAVDGGVLIKTVFRSLFSRQGKQWYALGLEPSCKFYLEEFLKVSLKINPDLEEVLKCLENGEEVREEETGKTIKKGEFFQLQFKNIIFGFLESQHVSLVKRTIERGDPDGLRLLVQVLENMKTGDPRAELPREMFARWKDFEKVELKDVSLDQKEGILLRLAVCGAQVIGTPGLLKVSPIADKIFSILENENLEEMNAGTTEGIFGLLPFLSTFGEETNENDRLDVCLSKIKIGRRASKSSRVEDLKSGVLDSFANGLLRSLKSTASLVLLRFLARKADWFEIVSGSREDVESALSVFADINTPLAHSVRALKLVYDSCFNDPKSEVSLTYRWFMEPVMRILPVAAVQQVVNENLSSLCDLITTDESGKTESLSVLGVNLKKKICAAKIIQTYVTRLTGEELDGLAVEKKCLIDKIPGRCFPLLKQSPPGKALKERHRKFMCQVFNMICCIICARCEDPKFYKLFIFDERGSFLYAAVDGTATYHLGMDFEEIPKRKKHLTLLRKSRAEESLRPFGEALDSVRYVQTNTLFASSLREDVTRFDFTTSSLRPLNEAECFQADKSSDRAEIELEMDALNSHECMATLVGVVSKLEREAKDSLSEPPCWLKFFLGVLKNPKLSRNLKLFVLKAIYNVENYVKSYCKEAFPVVLDSLLELFEEFPINYLLIDLIGVMLGWKEVPSGTSRTKLTRLVVSVVEKCDSSRRDIVKHNLEVIKTMIEVWKENLSLGEVSSVVFRRLLQNEAESGANPSGGVSYSSFEVSGILLSNGIPAWTEGKQKAFLDLVLKNFREENKKNQFFGEICGLFLKHAAKGNAGVLREYEDLVWEKIFSRPVSWMSLLYGVHRHHPKMSSRFAFKIFSSAWNYTDSFTAKKLEMLLSHVSRTDVPEDETLNRHWDAFLINMLNSADVAVQETSLRIVDKVTEKLSEGKSQALLKEALKLQKSVHPGVRKWVYEIASKNYQKNRGKEVGRQCKVVLLKGLNDGVKSVEETCLGFWSSLFQVSSHYSVLLRVFQETYTPETEHLFLSIAAKILLKTSAEDNRYEKSISLHPITHQCKFQKRTLVLGLRSSSLLSSTSRTWTNQSVETTATLRSRNLPYLRPTGSSLKFQPTIQDRPAEVLPEASDPSEETQLPRNPFKIRFYKSAEKTNFSFLQRYRKKKKRESEEEEDATRRKETEVEILGEYRAGDYPDIQISHSQMLRPLEALAKADHQIARLFLVAFYSGLMKIVKPEEKTGLLSETSNCFERMLKSSTSFDPGVFGFVLQVVEKHCRSFDLDCELISNAAVSSNWLSLGALIVEQIIAKEEDSDAEENPKRRKGAQNPGEKRWMELAKLYRSLEESDVVSGVFLDKVDAGEEARAALRSEALLDWLSASRHYEAVLQTDCDSFQNEFFTEAYLSSLAKLSDWSLANKCIRTTVDQNLDDLWKNYNLLSWFLKSQVMISLSSDPSDFKTILEEFCKNKSQLNVLSANFGEELAVFDWFSNKLHRAGHRIDRLCLDFLAGWSHLSKWSRNLRAAKLTGLQTLSELSFAVKSLAETSKFQLEENVRIGKERWKRNVPSPRDDLTVWDVKLGYRREFLKRAKDFDLGTSAIESDLALAKAALGQNHLNLAKKCLSNVSESLGEGDAELRAEYDHCLNLGNMVIADLKMKEEQVGVETYLMVWRRISKQLSAAMDSDSSASRTRLHRCNLTLGRLVSAILPSVTRESVSPDLIRSVRLEANSSDDSETPAKALKRKGLEYFEAAGDALEAGGKSSEAKSNAYLELARFILKFSEETSFPEFEKFSECVLKSMALGNPEARRLFGCALNLSEAVAEESSLKELVSESEAVPSWMFLMWINQMLASLNSKLFPLLKSIIFRIAQDHPNSIRYAFRLSKEECESKDPKTKAFFIRLGSLWSNDRLYEDFFNSMNYLGPPDLILRYHLENALRGNPDCFRMNAALIKLHELMFSSDQEKFRGSVFKFWDRFKRPLEEAMTCKEEGVLKEKLESILSSVEAARPPSGRALRDLGSYSPWLSDFHALKTEASLELPGQYDGTREPVERNLVTVSSFKGDVLVFDSKCRPMRISVLGNDALEHRYLVKFGEDLRQDERIQQVFEHFNHRLKESKRGRRFRLETYKVIPLTASLGMIQWIENNVSLFEMIENVLGDDRDLVGKAQAQQLAFLSQQSSSSGVYGSRGGVVAAHLLGYERAKREAAASNFKARVQAFPRDLLKRAFLGLSVSPEHFLHLRGNFATSHAVASLTHWLVGIGDRHLQNILVSTKSGRVLGIDFGYAFGFATQFLVPPELIPFRLTPQILNLMEPLRESGWIKQAMVHSLRLFRREPFGLLSVLEVFVREPLMDWLKEARKSERRRMENEENPEVWYPREKISIVEKKLNGANPVAVFEADLRAGHSESKHLEAYLEVLRGVERDNVRARHKEDGLAEEEQVECLIDLATDPHVLSKTYVGWNPWL